MPLTSDLQEFDFAWAQLFEAEASILRPVFDSQLDAIHHVGSTAIPGIRAKPEIDILVILKDGSDFPSYFDPVTSLGYDFRGEEEGVRGHWYFSKNQNGKRTHKLHLCGPNHPCVEDQILFRDFLKSHSVRANEYSRLKLKLASENKSGMAEYLALKAPFIQETLQMAKSWRAKAD